LVQQQAQTKAQLARYEDELTRKRMQAEHEAQRQRNVELVKMQEEAAVRQEQIRRSTEEQIQAQRRQTEKERAEIERETIRVRAMAEAEGRAYEAKAAEDVNRRMLIERANMEKEKWLAAINSTFGHIGGTCSWNHNVADI
jgi:ATPase family AAA domain-containing protein 3A/B